MSSAVPQRRQISYRGYELLLDEAEGIAASDYTTVGNWSYAQILDHLAKAYDASIDGVGVLLPWPVRVVGGFLLKGRLLNKTLPQGFKFPNGQTSRFAPDPDIDVETAMERFRSACHRCQTEKRRSLHPLLGRIDTAEWDRFNLRHAELHMSFVLPDEGPRDPDQSSTAPNPVPSHAS